MVKVRSAETVQHLSGQALQLEVARVVDAAERGTVQFGDYEAFVLCREELARRCTRRAGGCGGTGLRRRHPLRL